MQYANFIRDFKEDMGMNRLYFPIDDLCVKNLNTANLENIIERNDFSNFLVCQIDKFEKWQQEAEIGFAYIPKRYLIPIKTASDMYKWTIQRIKKDPTIVLRRKVKPSVRRIVWTIFKNSLTTNYLQP